MKIVDQLLHLVPSCSQFVSSTNEDRLIPGQSFLFAALELLVCVLLSYYPHIAGDLQLGPIFQLKLAVKSSSDHHQISELILSSVKLLSELITLCTSQEGKDRLRGTSKKWVNRPSSVDSGHTSFVVNYELCSAVHTHRGRETAVVDHSSID